MKKLAITLDREEKKSNLFTLLQSFQPLHATFPHRTVSNHLETNHNIATGFRWQWIGSLYPTPHSGCPSPPPTHCVMSPSIPSRYDFQDDCQGMGIFISLDPSSSAWGNNPNTQLKLPSPTAASGWSDPFCLTSPLFGLLPFPGLLLQAFTTVPGCFLNKSFIPVSKSQSRPLWNLI